MIVNPRNSEEAALAHLVIDVGMISPLDEPDAPLEPEVIRLILPDDQAGAVIGVVAGGRGPPRLEPAEYADTGREVPADAADDAAPFIGS